MPCVLQFHIVASKSDEKQKSFINSTFFCSEFQSVSRIVKIVHSVFASFSGWNISYGIGFDIFREIVPRHQFPRTIPQPFAPFWPNTIQVFTFQSWGFSRIEQLIARKSDFVWKGKQFLPLLSSRLFFIFEAKIYVSTAFLKPPLLGITNIFVLIQYIIHIWYFYYNMNEKFF